jgi:TolB-like protein
MSRTLLILTLTLLLGPSARAATRITVVPPDARGRGAARVARATLAAIVDQLGQARGVEVTTAGGRRAKLLKRCLERAGCLRRVGKRLPADLLLTGRVQRSRRRVVLELRLLRAASGELLGREKLASRRTRGLAARAAKLAGSLVRAQTAAVAPARPAAAETMVARTPVRQLADTEEP